MAVTAAMNMYTRKKMLGRKVAITGHPVSTGIGVPRDSVKNQKKAVDPQAGPATELVFARNL